MRISPKYILAVMMLSVIAVRGSGTVDPNFGNSPWPFRDREVEIDRIVLGPSGKVLIWTRSAGLARLNFDGVIDPTFSCAVPEVWKVAVAGDKLYVVHGRVFFPEVNGYGSKVSRLNENGSIDNSFASATLIPTALNGRISVRSMAPTLDGGCILGGWFDKTNEGGSTNIARFKANGSLDEEFAKNLNSPPHPYSICSLPNGQFVVSGVMQGDYPCAVIRLNADGTTDATFRAEFHSTIIWPNTRAMMTEIIPFSDLSVLIAGSCNTYGRANDPQRKSIASVVRLLPDGSLDPSFQADTDVWIVRAMGVQSDGKIVIASHSNETALVRLLPDGRRDTSFPRLSFQPQLQSWLNFVNGEPEREPPTAVLGLVIDQWDDINIVGRFTSLRGVNRTYLARILGGATDIQPSITPRINNFATVEFEVTGPKNYVAKVEATPDFTGWFPFTNFVMNGSNTFATAKVLNSRFFRVQVSRP